MIGIKFGITAVVGGLLTALTAVALNATHAWPAFTYLRSAAEAGVVTCALGIFIAACAAIWSADP